MPQAAWLVLDRRGNAMSKKEAGAIIRPDKPISEAAIRRAAKALAPLL